MSNLITKDLEQVAANTAAMEGFEIVGLQVMTAMKPMTIQLKIRHQGGEDVSIDDCSRLSKAIGTSIENSNLIDGPHVLEVSSPGLNEVLITDREFETLKGFPVEVSKKNSSNVEIVQSGLLHTRSKEHLLINIKGKISKIPRENVIQVRLASPT